MATRDGQITAIGIAGMTSANRDNLSIGLWGYDPAEYLDLTTGQSAETTLHEQRVINYPSVFAPGLSGQITHYYKEDYYHRIHVNPNPLALGNLLTEETREVYVWNAFFEAKTLNDVTLEDADGIEITEPVTTPADYPPLKGETYIVNISTAGPPIILATVNFEFAVYTVELSITGDRVTLWVWIPESAYREELKWMTNVLKTRQGEQRIGYREAPRQVFSYSFLRPPREVSQVKVAVDNWAHRQWGLPVWKEMTKEMTASAGDTAINFDTSYRDYREDGLAVIWESADKAEAIRITNVRADGLDIDPGLSNSYTNALVMPLRKAIAPEGISFNRGKTGYWTRFSATFIVTDNIDLSAASSYPQYDGYDVLTDGNIVIGDMSERISRPLVQIDNGQGPITIETTQDYSRFMRTVGKYTKTLAALWQWRQWLHSKYGRQKAFWLPSWNKDIALASTVYSTKTLAEIEYIGLNIHGTFPVDTRVTLTDGMVFYRQITGSEELTNGNERVSIGTSFGQDIVPGDIDLWCFMDLVRFDADSIELSHQNPYIMKTNIPVVRVPE